MTHPWLSWQSPARIREELAGCNAVLEDTLGAPVRFFRPPHGARRPIVLRTARELGLTRRPVEHHRLRLEPHSRREDPRQRHTGHRAQSQARTRLERPDARRRPSRHRPASSADGRSHQPPAPAVQTSWNEVRHRRRLESPKLHSNRSNLAGRLRHHSYHEFAKEWHRECSIPMCRAVDHPFLDERIAYRTQTFCRDSQLLRYIP